MRSNDISRVLMGIPGSSQVVKGGFRGCPGHFMSLKGASGGLRESSREAQGRLMELEGSRNVQVRFKGASRFQ